MTRVNLLPWREVRRKQREREFYVTLLIAALIGLAVALLWIFWMGARIDNQESRNDYLRAQITQLDAKIAQIEDLKETREQLLARKEIIEQLQANRAQMVHLFDELVKATPDSVRLTSLTQNGDKLHLEGVAQSNASVATYMRSIEASPWLGDIDLRKTEKEGTEGTMQYVFSLDTKLTSPEDDKDKDKNKGAEPSSASAGATAGGAA